MFVRGSEILALLTDSQTSKPLEALWSRRYLLSLALPRLCWPRSQKSPWKHWIYSDETCGKPWKPPQDPPSKLTKCVWSTLVAMTALHLSDGRSRVEHCTWVIFYCDTRTLCSKLNASSTITVQCEMCIAPGSVHQSTSPPDQQFRSHLWQAIKMRCIYVAGKKKLVKHCGFNWGGSSSSRVAQKWVCVFTHSCHIHWQFQFATPVYKTVFFH